MTELKIATPLTNDIVEKLHAGDDVHLSGVIYTARDAAHRRMIEALEKSQPLPFDVRGQVIYYVGPTPPKPGQVIGSAGPTTSMRLDRYTPALLAAGLKGIIGKGGRGPAVRQAHKGVYFIAVGGAGALLSRHIKKAEVIAYEDLGTEAIRRLEVEDFPAIVCNDIYGSDLLEQGKAQWRRAEVLQG
jgi:fumarate hydratase subunit beta